MRAMRGKGMVCVCVCGEGVVGLFSVICNICVNIIMATLLVLLQETKKET